MLGSTASTRWTGRLSACRTSGRASPPRNDTGTLQWHAARGGRLTTEKGARKAQRNLAATEKAGALGSNGGVDRQKPPSPAARRKIALPAAAPAPAGKLHKKGPVLNGRSYHLYLNLLANEDLSWMIAAAPTAVSPREGQERGGRVG